MYPENIQRGHGICKRIHCCARANAASRCEFGVVLQASGSIGIRGYKVVDGRRVGDWEVEWDQVWLGASENMGADGQGIVRAVYGLGYSGRAENLLERL